MTDLLFDVPEPGPLVGLVEGETVLVNERLGGLQGTFQTVIVVEVPGLGGATVTRYRYQVVVTDAESTGFEAGAQVSDWRENWRMA